MVGSGVCFVNRWFIWIPGTRKFCWVSLGERFEAFVLRFILNYLGNIQLVLGDKTFGIPAGDSQTKPSGLFCPVLSPQRHKAPPLTEHQVNQKVGQSKSTKL